MRSMLAVVIASMVIALTVGCGQMPEGPPTSDETPAPTPSSRPTLTPIAPAATPVTSPTPASTATPVPHPIPTATPVEGPGYGGHFIDPEDNSIVYVYLVNPSPEAVREVTSTHLAPAVGV